MSNVLEIQDVQKAYMSVKALKGVSFAVPKGSVYGILGPNGSGKTTLLGILLDVLKSDAGTFQWIGVGAGAQARRNIGCLLETPNFYPYLTAKNNLKISALIKQKGDDEIDQVLKKVNLYDRRDSAFSNFSLGMKQRLAIAAALLGNPQILVLDEPTNGLDPVGISEIRELIRQLNKEGITIIMASHLLDEVEKVCTDVAILKLGNLISCGPVTEVLSDEDWYEVKARNQETLISVLKNSPLVKEMKHEAVLLITLKEGKFAEELNQYCFEQGVILSHLQQRKRSLESKFMEITK